MAKYIKIQNCDVLYIKCTSAIVSSSRVIINNDVHRLKNSEPRLETVELSLEPMDIINYYWKMNRTIMRRMMCPINNMLTYNQLIRLQLQQFK
jgi:hypothetical protein